MLDLISRVQGTEGYLSFFAFNKIGKVRHRMFLTRAEFDAEVNRRVECGYNAFFGVARYLTDQNRTKLNVGNLKAVWVDLDCGEEKAAKKQGYLTQSEAVTALKGFCKTTGLPRPIIVDSGYGIHAYWEFDRTILRPEWEAVSRRLKEVCRAQGLLVDAAVFDATRVLRIPGTYNFKQDEPKLVRVLCDGTPIAVADLHRLLGVNEVPSPKPALTALQQQLRSNITFSFGRIIRRSARQDGCKQLLSQCTHPNDVSEPMWFDALSIAAHCVDRDKAIHKISEKYEGYDPELTERKAANSKYPHTCESFESNNPQGCEGCIHRGKIKTPLVLGREVLEAEPDAVIAPPEAELEEPAFEPGESEEDGVYRVPEYPFPFFRGKNGGVYMRVEGEDAECMYEHDLYIVKRMHDPNPEVGELALVRLHLPKDEVREFALPLSTILVKEKLREALAVKGVALYAKKLEGVGFFLTEAFKQIQCQKRAEQMRSQFGWIDNDKGFVIGDREIRADHVGYCPPSSVTKTLTAATQPKGSLEKWKEVFNLYDQPGLEANAFAALSAFGSPLLKFTGHSGAMINLIHHKSGTGKSTVLYMCNSVYGHPVDLTSIWRDTLAAKMIHLGVMKNLPFTCDELTNMSEQDHSTLAYSMSQGRGPNRAKSSANEMRANNTTWQTISVTTSNASVYEKLGAYKSSPDGEMMRLLEYQIEPTTVIDTETAKRMFDHQLRENYGHAGQVYVQYLINNLEESVQGLMAIQQKIDRDANLSSRERFWSAIIACNIAGGMIARKIGLIDWDMKRIYQWTMGMLKTLREDVIPTTNFASHVLGEFINTNINGLLIVQGMADTRTGLQTAPIREPRGELTVRYEPDTKLLFISSSAFNKYCAEGRISRKSTLKALQEQGIYIGAQAKRLSKGMGINAPPMASLMFNCATLDDLNLEEVGGE